MQIHLSSTGSVSFIKQRSGCAKRKDYNLWSERPTRRGDEFLWERATKSPFVLHLLAKYLIWMISNQFLLPTSMNIDVDKSCLSCPCHLFSSHPSSLLLPWSQVQRQTAFHHPLTHEAENSKQEWMNECTSFSSSNSFLSWHFNIIHRSTNKYKGTSASTPLLRICKARLWSNSCVCSI